MKQTFTLLKIAFLFLFIPIHAQDSTNSFNLNELKGLSQKTLFCEHYENEFNFEKIINETILLLGDMENVGLYESEIIRQQITDNLCLFFSRGCVQFIELSAEIDIFGNSDKIQVSIVKLYLHLKSMLALFDQSELLLGDQAHALLNLINDLRFEILKSFKT